MGEKPAMTGPAIVVAEFMPKEGLEMLQTAGEVHYAPAVHNGAAPFPAKTLPAEAGSAGALPADTQGTGALPADPPPADHQPTDPGPAEALPAEILGGARALIVRNKTRVGQSLLSRCPRLEVVGRLGAGLDNIDVEACRRRNITVVYSPWGNSRSVAEHTLALALALARRIHVVHGETRRGRWDRRGAMGVELAGSPWGIIGYGRVARFLAPAVKALGMDCITYHPRKAPDHPDFTAAGVSWVGEEELFRRSRVLSVHLPLTDETRRYIDARRLAMLPRGAFLVHTGRGGVVDESALAETLAAGHLGGAALDVREEEPPARPDELAAMAGERNVILTPHAAGLTEQAQAAVARHVAEDVVQVLSGGRPRFPA